MAATESVSGFDRAYIELCSRRAFWSRLFATAVGTRIVVGAQDSTSFFSTGTSVANIFATVRDKHGEIVRGLRKEDFNLQVDGHPEPIRYFTAESELPLTLGLLFDRSGSMAGHLKREKMAARAFVSKILREGDRAFVVSFAGSISMDQPLTHSKAELDRILAAVDGGGAAGGTRVYDAVSMSCEIAMSKLRGRRALIVFSDGDDNASGRRLGNTIEACQSAGALVYALELGLGRRRATSDWEKLAVETGGHYFAYSRKPSERYFTQIEEELRHQYFVGFDPPDKSVGLHPIRLRATQKDLKVQAPSRYFIQG